MSDRPFYPVKKRMRARPGLRQQIAKPVQTTQTLSLQRVTHNHVIQHPVRYQKPLIQQQKPALRC